MAQRQGLDERLGCQRAATTDQDLVQHRAQRSPNRKLNHLCGDCPRDILSKARHAVSPIIGDPDLHQLRWNVKSRGNLDARPTVNDDTLYDLGSLDNADCAAA